MEPIYGPLTATLCWHGLHRTWAMGFHGLHTLNDLHFCPFSQLGSHYPRMLSIPTSIVLLMGTITSTPRHLADWNMQAGAFRWWVGSPETQRADRTPPSHWQLGKAAPVALPQIGQLGRAHTPPSAVAVKCKGEAHLNIHRKGTRGVISVSSSFAVRASNRVGKLVWRVPSSPCPKLQGS